MTMPAYFGAARANKKFVSSIPARALNTPFVVSSIYDAMVFYTPRLSATGSITIAGSSSSTAQCDLQIRETPGSGAWTTIGRARIVNATSGAVLIGITVTDTLTEDIEISGFIPAGYEVQLASTTSGTASVSMTSQPQQEATFQ